MAAGIVRFVTYSASLRFHSEEIKKISPNGVVVPLDRYLHRPGRTGTAMGTGVMKGESYAGDAHRGES